MSSVTAYAYGPGSIAKLGWSCWFYLPPRLGYVVTRLPSNSECVIEDVRMGRAFESVVSGNSIFPLGDGETVNHHSLYGTHYEGFKNLKYINTRPSSASPRYIHKRVCYGGAPMFIAAYIVAQL